jgi:ribosomal-protein-alanine N-acetyltransferase
MTFDILETPRLKLRKMTPDVYEHVLTHYSDEELKAFFGFPSNVEVAKEREKQQKGVATYNRSFLYFHLLDKETGNTLGYCGYHTWYVEHFRAEIGYILYQEEAKGKGLMKEAIKPVIDYGFNQMQLHRIEALIGLDNTPSLQLVKNLHFTQEGYLRQHYNLKGQMVDSLLFSLLRSEYGNSQLKSPAMEIK